MIRKSDGPAAIMGYTEIAPEGKPSPDCQAPAAPFSALLASDATMFSLIEMLGKRSPLIHIVDVGAMWLGENDLPYNNLLKADRFDLVGFEPQPAECEKLTAMRRKGHRYLPYFIGDGSRRTFHLTTAPMTSSLYEPNMRLLPLFQTLAELTTTVSTEDVQTKRLDDIPEIPAVDYLKLDVQGAEVDCIRGAHRLLADCVAVFTEVNFIPMYKDMPLFAEVDLAMRELGFMLHHLEPSHSRCFVPFLLGNDVTRGVNQTIWSNAMYVKDFTRLGTLSAEQLLKMAVIVHECHGSYDLTAHILRYYDARSGSKPGSGLWPLYCQRMLGVIPELPPVDPSELVPLPPSQIEAKPPAAAPLPGR